MNVSTTFHFFHFYPDPKFVLQRHGQWHRQHRLPSWARMATNQHTVSNITVTPGMAADTQCSLWFCFGLLWFGFRRQGLAMLSKWPRIQDFPTSTSRVLGSQVCTITPVSVVTFSSHPLIKSKIKEVSMLVPRHIAEHLLMKAFTYA